MEIKYSAVVGDMVSDLDRFIKHFDYLMDDSPYIEGWMKAADIYRVMAEAIDE